MIFAPINVAAFRYTPPHLRGAAVGLFALLRNEGGSVGTSMAQIIEQRREQFHLARVGENLEPAEPDTCSPSSSRAKPSSSSRPAIRPRSQQMTLPVAGRPPPAAGGVPGLLRRLLAVRRPGLGLVLLVFLMKRSVAEKGEIIGGE